MADTDVRRIEFEVPVRIGTFSGVARAIRYEPRVLPKAQLPLLYTAGYELPEADGIRIAAEGNVVATPADEQDLWPGTHPVVRGPEPDLAIAESLLALDHVDLHRVRVGGGSAGGYQALMVAANLFPVAAAAVDTPIVDLRYIAAYWEHNSVLPDAPPHVQGTQVQLPQLRELLGLERHGWRTASPVDLLELITCPVSATFGTADVLVPLDQLMPCETHHGAAGFDPGYTTDPAVLGGDRFRPLADLLGARLHVETVVAAERIVLSGPQAPWTVTIVDEGPATPEVAHFREEHSFDRSAFNAAMPTHTPVERLTAAKLAGLAVRLEHADRLGIPATATAIGKGLAHYAGPAGHAGRLRELCDSLPGPAASLRRLVAIALAAA
jgi:hypothetical protein